MNTFTDTLRHLRDRAMSQPPRTAEDSLLLSVGLLTVWTWVRDRTLWLKLSDTQLPNNALLLALAAARIRQRVLAGPIEKLTQAMAELGTVIGRRMLQSDERSAQELQLQQSLESFARAADDRDRHMVAVQESLEAMTKAADARDRQLLSLQRQVVRLTVVLGLIGVATIGVTIWAAAR